MKHAMKLCLIAVFISGLLHAHVIKVDEDVAECRLIEGMHIDLATLQEEFESIKQLIALRPQHYFPGGLNPDPWQGIALKNALGTTEPKGLEVVYSINYGKMLTCYPTEYLKRVPYIQSLLDRIEKQLNAEIGLVRIFKIPAGKQIIPHSDGTIFDIYDGAICRLHIPIISDPNVQFIINDKSFYLEPGKLYYTNVALTHYVLNKSRVDRVHLIIDLHAHDELREYILKSEKNSYVPV